ncbi:MAG TPA: hypothetical protein VH559_09340 [Gemmatimonadaceae bacterium]
MQTTIEQRVSDPRVSGLGPLRVYGRRLARLRRGIAEEAQEQVHAARHGMREARRRAEDERDAMMIGIRRHPFRAVGLAFALGGVVVFLAGSLARKMTRR